MARTGNFDARNSLPFADHARHRLMRKQIRLLAAHDEHAPREGRERAPEYRFAERVLLGRRGAERLGDARVVTECPAPSTS